MSFNKLKKKLFEKLSTHPYGLTLFIYLSAAILTGIACVAFMRAFELVFGHLLDFKLMGAWCWLTTPLLFLAAIEMIRHFAPCADGAGIPQTIFAAKHMTDSNFKKISPLISWRTMVVKIIALLVGVWGGASTGREGPTVHIAACLFFGITFFLHKMFKLTFNMRSAVVAGGAAGLAAAFNTPLAGVTFAIEELSSDYFVAIKDMVLIAIIVAGLAAQTITGEYTYFGRLGGPYTSSLLAVLTVGIISGAAGTFFSVFLVKGRRWVMGLTGWPRYLVIIILAWGVLGIALYSGMKGIMGPGNAVAQEYVEGNIFVSPVLFYFFKMAATYFTYWSGIAGGIFAPSLSMGAGMGAWVGGWLHEPIGICAVVGMAAFLAGTIQAPITSFVIIYEMTGQHQMLLPIMLASLIGYMVARVFKAKHLYQALASFYNPML